MKLGLTKNKSLYNIWGLMKQRCYNPKNPLYKNYGGRGISVCNEWRYCSYNFICWALESGYKSGLNLDRINNNGNYEPSNCRFADNKLSGQNKRTTKLNQAQVRVIRKTHGLTHAELGVLFGVSRLTITAVKNNTRWVA